MSVPLPQPPENSMLWSRVLPRSLARQQCLQFYAGYLIRGFLVFFFFLNLLSLAARSLLLENLLDCSIKIPI